MDVRFGLYRKLSPEKLMLLKLGKTLESVLDSKGIKLVSKNSSPEYLLEGLMLKLKLHLFKLCNWDYIAAMYHA